MNKLDPQTQVALAAAPPPMHGMNFGICHRVNLDDNNFNKKM